MFEYLKVFIFFNILFYMDHLKEAFRKVKEDINYLREQNQILSSEISKIKEKLYLILDFLQENQSRLTKEDSTFVQKNPTNQTDNSTHLLPFKPLNHQKSGISTGNQGASTDRQTDRQTDKTLQNTPLKTIDDAVNVLNSLNSIKKEIRLKFKQLTEQEISVFSAIYQLDEEKGYADYNQLSKKLNLTESSIRDYVGRLLRKGIPIEKKRINNKFIQLNVSQNLKKIASLSTILSLRDL